MKVLVVDDSVSIQMAIKAVLNQANYQIETAGDGAAALSLYCKFKPDIVLLDMSMPIMDGKETLRRLLSLDQKARITRKDLGVIRKVE